MTSQYDLVNCSIDPSWSAAKSKAPRITGTLDLDVTRAHALSISISREDAEFFEEFATLGRKRREQHASQLADFDPALL